MLDRYTSSVVSAAKAVRLCAALFLLFALPVACSAQTDCATRHINKSGDVFEQIVKFFADEKLGVAGDGLAFLGMAKENPKIEAIGHAIDLAHFIAEQIEKSHKASETLELCKPLLVGPLPGYRSLSILGTQADMRSIGAGNSLLSSPSIRDLLKPYESQSTNLPSFPDLSSSLAGKPSQQQQTPWRPASITPRLATVSGRVLDEHGNPVAGAVVSLASSTISASQPQWRMTTDDGSYSFAVFPGAYFISARLNSVIQGGTLESGGQTVSLPLPTTTNVNLYLHPPSRGGSQEAELTPEQKGMIVDFIAAADEAECTAAREGNPQYLEQFYTGAALQMARGHFNSQMQSGVVSCLKSGQTEAIRYFPATFSIVVDTVEVWSYQSAINPADTPHTKSPNPQTITVRQTPRGWFISDVQFKNVTGPGQ